METSPRKGISLKQLAVETYGATPIRERADFDDLLARVKAAARIHYFEEFLANPNGSWLYVDGDVDVPGDLLVDAPVVIGGSLKVAGIYDDYHAGMGHALVMGDLEAEHVLTWCDLGVIGDLKVRGLVYAYYNDHVVELSGGLEARAFVIFDKSCSYDSKNMRVDHFATEYSTEGEHHSLQLFHPDVMFEALEPSREDPDFETDRDGQLPGYDVCQRRLWDGEPIFREVPAAEELLERVAEAMTLDVESEEDELRALVGQDPLVDSIVEFRLTPEPEPEPYSPPTRAEIEAMLAHEDEWERRQLLEHHDVLLFDDFAALARDKAAYTRDRCARALRDQSIGNRKQTLSPEERHRLAEVLAADAESDVRAQAMGALPVASQERFGLEALAAVTGDGTEDEQGNGRILRQLASYTPSESLQLTLFDSGRRELLTSLAGNPFLGLEAQRRIQGLLPQLEAAGIESDDVEDLDMAIAFMLDNPVTDPKVVCELATATLGHQGRTSILHSWRTQVPMTSESAAILRDAVDENMRYEWPEMVLRAPDATRGQLTEALTQRAEQDGDEGQQAWVTSLEALDDPAFFEALKSSEDEDIALSEAALRSSGSTAEG